MSYDALLDTFLRIIPFLVNRFCYNGVGSDNSLIALHTADHISGHGMCR